MYCCFRQTFSLPKKFLISNKSYPLQYFSALSSMRNRISSNNYYKNGTFLKINKPNSVLNRGFSVKSLFSFYDSVSSSEACKLLTEALVKAHDFTGFSWTVILIAVSAVLKLFIALPCGIYQKFLISKLELINIELAGLKKKLSEKIKEEAIKERWTEKKLKFEFMCEVLRERRILVLKNNCHPFKTIILFFIQLPFWLLMSVTIRKFAKDAYNGQSDYPVAALQFQVGGPFWSPNLSLPDPTFIIPTINFLALMTCIELAQLSKIEEKVMGNKAKHFIIKILPYFSRLLAVFFFFVSSVASSGVSFFWMSCTLIALAESLLLMFPKVRRFFRIPKTPSEYDKPFSQVKNRLVEKFLFKK